MVEAVLAVIALGHPSAQIDAFVKAGFLEHGDSPPRVFIE
jgi:hypothetical protein